MPIIITSVDCANELACDVPLMFYIDISPALTQQIVKVSETIKNNNYSSIDLIGADGLWSCIDPADFDEALDCIDDIVKALEQDAYIVECFRLHIMDTSFHWSAIPRRLGKDMRLTSQTIPIDVLKRTDTNYICIL